MRELDDVAAGCGFCRQLLTRVPINHTAVLKAPLGNALLFCAVIEREALASDAHSSIPQSTSVAPFWGIFQPPTRLQEMSATKLQPEAAKLRLQMARRPPATYSLCAVLPYNFIA